MTNEEAIKVIKELNYRCGICGLSQLVVCTDAKDIAIKSLNENTKLKAEIEQLKTDYKDEANMVNEYTEIMVSQRKGIEQLSSDNSNLRIMLDKKVNECAELKSELEQAVKLPCKVGDKLFGYCSAFGQILEYGLESVIIDEIEAIYCISAWSGRIGEYPSECLDELEIQYSDFGKTIFLTLEEAEQALKDMVKKC